MATERPAAPAWEICVEGSTTYIDFADDRRVEVENRGGAFVVEDDPYLGVFGSPEAIAERVVAGVSPVATRRVSAVRRNFLDLDDDDRSRLASALNQAYAVGWVDTFARMHQDGWPNPDPNFPGIHFTPQFLPWHRWMVREFEKKLQTFDPLVSIPYWDLTSDESLDWDGPMLGSFFGGLTNSGGGFDHWDIEREPLSTALPNLWLVTNAIQSSSYLRLRSLEVGTIHVSGHRYVGGDMNSPLSPRDPLFYLHHSNVDRVWALWQLNKEPGVPEYDETRLSSELLTNDEYAYKAIGYDDRMYVAPYYSGWTARVKDVISHRALGYRYSEDSRLEDYWQENSIEGLVSGDGDVFYVVPSRVEMTTSPGNVEISTLSLLNDTDVSVHVAIEEWPTVSGEGPVDGFAWWQRNTTIPPHDSIDHIVLFAPQHGGLYNFTMHVTVSSDGITTEMEVPIIGIPALR